MSFFSSLFAKPAKENVLIVHAGSASVGGAYALIEKGRPPTLYYTARVPIEPHEGEAGIGALSRALEALCAQLAREGGPALLRATGDAHVSRAVAYIAAPWEETSVRSESIEPGREFTVTHATRARAMAHGKPAKAERRASADTVIGTRLNGYATNAPFGKRATRAEFIILSSSLDNAAANAVERALRIVLHRHPAISAFLPAAYRAVRALYPHEEDYFLIDATGDATSIALVEKRALADTRTIPHGTRELAEAALKAGIHAAQDRGSAGALALIDGDRNQRFGAAIEAARAAWRTSIMDELRSFAAAHALPRTLFLLADEDARAFLRSALGGSEFNSLWLTDDPPRVIALAPSSVSAVSTKGEASGDLFLMLLALADNQPEE